MENNRRMDRRFDASARPTRETPQRSGWPLRPAEQPERAEQPDRDEHRPLGLVFLLALPLLAIATVAGTLLVQASPNRQRAPQALATSCTPRATVSATSVAAAAISGAQAATLSTQLSASCATTGIVDFAVYNATNTLVYQTWLSNVTLRSSAQTFQTAWQLPARLPSGAYVLKIGVFTAYWQHELAWVDMGASFQVANGSVIPSTPSNTPTPTNTPSNTPSNTPMPSNTPTTGTANPTNTPSPINPPSGGNPPTAPTGGALAPGAALPTEAACAAAIPSSSSELRQDNAAADHSVPTSAQIAGLASWDGSIGMDPRADALRRSISGNYTGTTDQILQWVACKWGIDPNIVRAEAVTESNWHQNAHGDLTGTTADCPQGAATSGGSCYQSYGILQIKWKYNKSAWPMSRDDTAFSAEYTYGLIRACYEGYDTWLGNGYKAGDIWGCLGFWYSGGWYASGAQNYIDSVKSHYTNQDWLKAGF